MKRSSLKKILCLTLCLMMLVCVAGCGKRSTSEDAGKTIKESSDLMEGITVTNSVQYSAVPQAGLRAALTFSQNLFNKCVELNEKADTNTLVSPLSVLMALAMTANGADGNTLTQMQDVLGLTTADMNELLGALIYLTNEDKADAIKYANAIWFKDEKSFAPKSEFLEINKKYYGASIYKALFDDSTLKEINAWIEAKTDGMIKDALDRIDPNAVMYLINALCFEAKWQSAYTEAQIGDGDFLNIDGSTSKVKNLHSSENVYITTDNATGFMKFYEGERYAFVGLLPNEGTSVSEVAASLSKVLADFDSYRDYRTVNVTMPKFTLDYSTELKAALCGLGMTDAFSEKAANFSRMCTVDGIDGGVYINRVIHKTHIELDEEGTKAAAVTIVEMNKCTAVLEPEFTPSVILDRPFLYMIYDTQTGMPVFIGNINQL